MRGEETQLLGLLALRPGFEGIAVLPGTHSKWVEIRGGKIMRFSSAMTGELFEVLSQHSVLRHSFAGDTNGPATEAGIAEGIEAGIAHPPGEELGEELLHHVAHALGPVVRAHSRSSSFSQPFSRSAGGSSASRPSGTRERSWASKSGFCDQSVFI